MRFFRSPRVPRPLLEQAAALAVVAGAAARALRGEGASATAAQQAGAARAARRAAREALRPLRGPAPALWPSLLRRLGDACDELGWAVEEAEGLPSPASWPKAAAAIAAASLALQKALRRPSGSEPWLLEVKRRAGEAERHCREGRREGRSEEIVRELKSDGVSRRLAAAAESLQEAADALAEILV